MNNIRLLYIDLFCGAGGTSTGVESAKHEGKKCAMVVSCVNHDANAIASHEENHPNALHFTEDIRTLELSPLLAHVKKMKDLYTNALVVVWASLECTNFSKAMDNRQAEKILHDYNKWRRGGKGKTPDPRLVGKAIDEAIVLFRQARNAQNFAKEETV